MTEKNNDKDLDRVAREVMLVLENESIEVVVNSLGSALITVFWNVHKENSKKMIEIFCDNLIKVIDDVENKRAEFTTRPMKRRFT
jgi:hypothetical protein